MGGSYLQSMLPSIRERGVQITSAHGFLASGLSSEALEGRTMRKGGIMIQPIQVLGVHAPYISQGVEILTVLG